MERRLAAILAADVVGYSRLMGADEENTLKRLNALRQDVVEPKIAAHSGRVVKLMGDGLLAEFASVVESVKCAVDIQEAMIAHEGDLPSENRLTLRIGVNIGDVIVEGDDIFGDGVNVAARLEALAEPGGVCISGTVLDHVKGKVSCAFEDRGEQRVKNIEQPVRVHSVVLGREAEAGTQDSSPADGAALPEQADKPSIAVLPFDNMSGDPEQEYFVDGMVEDIITALSRFDQLFVIARNSCFVYKGKAVDIKQVGRELGVRYVLEGSVRKAGRRVRITGQLIDAASGAHLWADKFDGDLEDVFELQDMITANVVGAIEPTMRKAEIERARRKPVENLGAYDLYLRALPHIYAIRPDDNLRALELLNRAIDLDPNYAPALSHAAWCLVQRITRAWDPAGEDDVAKAIALARRALAAGSDDAVAVVLGGFVLVMVGKDYSTGLSAVRRAVDRNPGSGFVNAMAGSAMVFADDLDAGLSHLERAMALGPLDPGFFSQLTVAACARLFAGQPDLAVELAERSIALNAEWDSTYWVLIAAYVRLGCLSDAQAAVARLLELSPEATVSKYRNRLPIRNPDSLQLVLDGLRQAGLQEGA